MSERQVFLDHHSTTPCDPAVLARMLPYFCEAFGNPASVTHQHGREAAKAVEEARWTIGKFLGAAPAEIVFTAGATESNNIALRGLLKPGDHFVTDSIEHRSVLAPAELVRLSGVDVTIVEPDREGFISPEVVEGALRPETRLVSVMAANGEIGTIEPIDQIGRVCRSRGVLLHTDATQAIGKIPFDLEQVECDLVSFSGHKIYGPKGIGGLYVRSGVRLHPLVTGGGQERGLRSGTVNVPGVVGLAAAIELSGQTMEEEAARLTSMRNHLWARLTDEFEGVFVHGPRELRLPGNLNVGFDFIDAESLMMAMRGFSLSAGSACSSGERGPSYVLRAIGVDERRAVCSIRIGLGRTTTVEDLEMMVAELHTVVPRLREITV